MTDKKLTINDVKIFDVVRIGDINWLVYSVDRKNNIIKAMDFDECNRDHNGYECMNSKTVFKIEGNTAIEIGEDWD